MWIEGDKEKIFFCIEKDVNQIENIEIEIGEDVIEQGRRLLES